MARVYVVEFQKRGLPHTHFLLIMEQRYKLTCLEQYDHLICAELPDKVKYPLLNQGTNHLASQRPSPPASRQGVPYPVLSRGRKPTSGFGWLVAAKLEQCPLANSHGFVKCISI
jgi:hypothetical protein